MVVTVACRECGAPLAPDQCYCVECGTRHTALPSPVACELHAISSRWEGEPVALAIAAVPDREPSLAALAHSIGSGGSVIAPRAAAVAVMGMLSFGVVVGSGADSLANPPLVVAFTPVTPAVAPLATAPATTTAVAVAPVAAPASTAAAIPQVAAASTGATSSAAGTTTTANSSPSVPFGSTPPIKHFFLIMLADQGYNQTFGIASKAKYFSKTLVKQGELVGNYYAVAQGELANSIGLLSGQGPTPETSADCPTFAQIKPTGKGALGQLLGTGCVYPAKTKSLLTQLTAKHDSWKAYVEGLGKGVKGQAASCAFPKSGAADGRQAVTGKNVYVTWRNPVVYFSGLTAKKGGCQGNDVALTELATDLKTVATTPAFSYISPSPCDDGSDTPCKKGAKAGLGQAEAFLKKVLPQIESSPAYKADGMIAITFDQAPQTGPHADPASCCNTPTYPNLAATGTSTTTTTTTTPTGTTTTPAAAADSTVIQVPQAASSAPATTTPVATTTTTSTVPYAIAPTTTTTTPATTTPATTAPATTSTTPTTTTPANLGGETSPTGGGGQVGMLLISQYVKPASTDLIDYFNHFSLLKSIEAIFKLGGIGYASDPSLPAFGAATYNAGSTTP